MKNVRIDVCCGARCTMMGSTDLLEKADEIKSLFPDDNISINAMPCGQECKGAKQVAPIVIINGEKMTNATPQKFMGKIMEVLR